MKQGTVLTFHQQLYTIPLRLHTYLCEQKWPPTKAGITGHTTSNLGKTVGLQVPLMTQLIRAQLGILKITSRLFAFGILWPTMVATL